MKVLIVSPCDLPIPAVKGGAVATLIESLVKENDIHKKFEFTIISSWDADAVHQSKKYLNTQFIWYKEPKWIKLIDNYIDFINMKFFHSKKKHEYLRKISVISFVRKHLSESNYDAVVLENSGYLLRIFDDEQLMTKYKDKIYFHLHNDIADNANVSVLNKVKPLLISEYLKKKLVYMCGNDIANKCKIVKNGIDVSIFSKMISNEEKKKLLEKLNIDEGKNIILFVGRIQPSKGIAELLDAISKLEDKEIVLLVVGSTNFGAKDISEFEISIRKKCDQMKDKVKFTGFVHNSELWKIYASADMAVLPSMWEEPAGLTIIEAAAARLPVITTMSGGIPEYLNSDYVIMLERNDQIVDSIKEAIINVLENKEEWKQRALKASEYVKENFSESAFYHRFAVALND